MTHQPPPTTDPQLVYASFGQRALGVVADSGLLAALGMVLRMVLLAPFLFDAWEQLSPILLAYGEGDAVSLEQAQAALPALGWLATASLVSSLVLNLAYFSILEKRSGRTVGKSAVSIRVVDQDSLGPISLRQALVRSAAKYLSLAPLGLGLLWMLRDPRRRTWHDLLASTVVIVEPTKSP